MSALSPATRISAVLLILSFFAGCGGPPPVRTVDVSGRAIPLIRVGLATGQKSAQATGTGRFQIFDRSSGDLLGEATRGRVWRFVPNGAWIELIPPGGSSQGLYRGPVYLKPSDRKSRIWVSGVEYRGVVEIRSDSGGGLTIVNEVDVENYLRGVVPSEIGRLDASYLAAIKAQAIAARTYVLSHRGRRSALGFDVFATVDDQVYRGFSVENPLADRAILETLGVVATYKGAMIQTYYSSTCGGATESIEEGWGRDRIPYLDHVKDRGRGRGDFCATSPYYRWSETWNRSTLESILTSSLPSFNGGKKGPVTLQDLRIRRRSKSGRAQLLEITTDQGKLEIQGDDIRRVLRRSAQGNPALRSTLFALKIDRDGRGAPGTIIAEGGGYGHGIGLCQVGAIGMASRGYRYDQILKHYYRGIDLKRAY